MSLLSNSETYDVELMVEIMSMATLIRIQNDDARGDRDDVGVVGNDDDEHI